MTFATHATQAPAGVVDTLVVRLSHAAWPNDLWYVDDVVERTFDDEDGNPVTAQPTGASADGEPTDDTGLDSRQVVLPDPDMTLWRRLEALSQDGDERTVEVGLYRYISDSLTAPTVYAVLTMVAPSRDGRMVSFEASNANVLNRDAPPRRFNYSDNPGLRR